MNQQKLHSIGQFNLYDKIKLNTRTGYLLINTEDILYCEAEGNYTTIFLSNGNNEISTLNLGKIQKLLSVPHFSRISRSIIMNTQYLYKVDRKKRICVLQHGSKTYELPIPEKQLRTLKL
ncbi:LytTR family transcriptional regulator DNA-binding domain-containing protein [Fulvivirgaceae bacterium BMA10]|uniref:LytTR family transcriptional regulator DNA-binding domain-containing protein n=1 Tax=Splendidivirga corallicola TaxID=3051826 RepID=A0ABT8KJ92_9BACT|nr:LytTR family transcriptional regulator DNA-binding domain-containing protein [Fulvivirgaceae bacterium BMA10]